MILRRILCGMVMTTLAIGCASQAQSSDDDDDGGGASGHAGGAGGGAADNACTKFIACIAASQPDILSEIIDTYGPDGTCWKTLDADTCIQACNVGFTSVSELAPNVLECRPPSAVQDGDYLAVFSFDGDQDRITDVYAFSHMSAATIDDGLQLYTWQSVLASDRLTPTGPPTEHGPEPWPTTGTFSWQTPILIQPDSTHPATDGLSLPETEIYLSENFVSPWPDTMCGDFVATIDKGTVTSIYQGYFSLTPLSTVDLITPPTCTGQGFSETAPPPQ